MPLTTLQVQIALTLILVCTPAVWGQSPPFTLEQVMSSPFPSELGGGIVGNADHQSAAIFQNIINSIGDATPMESVRKS